MNNSQGFYNFLRQNVTEFNVLVLCLSYRALKSLILFTGTVSLPHSKCIVFLTGIWLKWVFKGHAYFFIHSLHSSILFSPILTVWGSYCGVDER